MKGELERNMADNAYLRAVFSFKWYIYRLECAEGVDALLRALLYDAYSDDRSSTCVNLQIIVTKFEQQCYRESV